MEDLQMSRYGDGLKLIEESCGNGKDNVISLATIAIEPNADGKLRPHVRDADAFYEDGAFYITTSAKSNKMKQIAHNKEVAFAVCFEGISGSGIGENLGWVLDPKNAELRAKLRKAFSAWYDQANNEQDENCVILAIRITRAMIFRDHGAVRYNMDFINKTETEEEKTV
jgi:general stress protein 26